MRPPVVLTVAGSDNSCGAGLQADLKTISALGGYAQTAATCVVAEVPGRVSAIQPVRPGIVAEQIRLSLEAFPVRAAKTGMLFSTAIIRAVAAAFDERPCWPLVVVDPVMVASSGDPLLKRGATEAYRRLLFPKAALVTPNLDELRMLTGRPCGNLGQMRSAGQHLVEEFGVPFLLKGGHLKGKSAVDLLVGPEGCEEFEAPFVRGAETHGTGCTYSAAIATGLACGLSLREAVAQGKSYITAAIRNRHRWGRTSALNHRLEPA